MEKYFKSRGENKRMTQSNLKLANFFFLSFFFFFFEVEKDSFVAFPGKGGHRGLMPSKLCVQTWSG